VYLKKQQIKLTPIACRTIPNGIAFKFLEILNRDDAEKIPKDEIEAEIDLLPKTTQDNYMIEDLINFKLSKQDGHLFAIVKQCYNFGASDIIECELLQDMINMKKEDIFSIPIIKDVVLDINFDNQEIIVSDNIDYYLNNNI
jgi:ribosomal 30S subunit maturation factor RimM